MKGIERQRLSDQVAGHLRELIVEGELEAGKALPSERELARRFGVSATVLREALRALGGSGMLESRHGVGSFVTTPDLWRTSEPIAALIRNGRATLLHVLELRILLEIAACGLAAARHDVETLHALDYTLVRMADALHDPVAYVEADMEFHRALAAATANPVLPLVLSTHAGAGQDQHAAWHPPAGGDRARPCRASPHPGRRRRGRRRRRPGGDAGAPGDRTRRDRGIPARGGALSGGAAPAGAARWAARLRLRRGEERRRDVRITHVEPIVLRVPDLQGEACDGTQDTLLVRVHTDEGLIGLGEVDSSPEVMRAIIEAPVSHLICRGLATVLLGEDPFDVARLWQRMYRASIYYGRQGAAIQAISGVDIALWDLIGQASGRPVAQMLGGAHRQRIRVYASLLMPERPEEIAALVAPLVRRGFTAVKFGWGPLGRDEGLDVELVAAARAAIGPERLLLIDAGWAYSVKRAARICRRWEPYELYWLEEPLPPDDLAGYARLVDLVDVRIATGEEESGVRAFRRLIEEGRVDVIQPDVARAGGLTECRRIGELAADAAVEMVPHAFKTGILQAASLHLAATLPQATLCELTVHEGPLARGLTNEDFMQRLEPDGTVAIPTGPGLGVSVDEETIRRYRV